MDFFNRYNEEQQIADSTASRKSFTNNTKKLFALMNFKGFEYNVR